MATVTHPNFPGYVFHANGTMTRKDGTITEGSQQGDYMFVFIKDAADVWNKVRLHRVLIEAFSGEAGGDREVDHINGKSTDNRIENLRYLSKAEHRRHTQSCNVGHNQRSASKRGKAVIATDTNGDTMTFETVMKAAMFFELPKGSSGVISKACKTKGTVRGWTIKYVNMDAVNETWLKVDYPGLDSSVWVSNYGRIRTNRVTTLGNACGDYYKMMVKINGKNVTKMVHTFVCWTFHGPAPDGASSVNHKDRNGMNNRPENLEWSDPVAQAQHKISTSKAERIGALPIPMRVDDIEDMDADEMEDMDTEDVDEKDADVKDVEDVDADVEDVEDANVNNIPSILILDPEYKAIQKAFKDLSVNKDSEGAIKHNKATEVSKFKYKHSLKWYEDKVYSSTNVDEMERMEIVVEHVETEEQQHMWSFFRVHTSSFASIKSPGRYLSFLVKDNTTNKYVGIFALGSDVYACKARDSDIGWSYDFKRVNLVSIMNIRTCIGLQPVSFNFNVGKLIASLCFSREVLTIAQEAYNQPIAALTTFGVNGRAPQYERIKCLKFIGVTRGMNTDFIPDELYNRTCNLFKKYDVGFDPKRTGKLKKLSVIADVVGIPFGKLVDDGKQRGIYIGYTGENAGAYLRGEVPTFEQDGKSIAEIACEWKARWARQRHAHLVDTGRLKATAKVEWTIAPAIVEKEAPTEAEDKPAIAKKGDVYQAPKSDGPKVPLERPGARGIEKTTTHKIAIATQHVEVTRQRSGVTDAVIDDVRRRIAAGEKNVAIEAALNLSRKQVTSIKNRVMIKQSELKDEAIATEYLENKKAKRLGLVDSALSASQKRRKVSAEKVIEILKFAEHTPIGYARLVNEAQERFAITTITIDVAKGLLQGKVRLDPREFPIDGVTFEEYDALIGVISARDYSRMPRA